MSNRPPSKEPPFRVIPAGQWIEAALAKSTPDYLVDNFVPYNGFTVISGPPKHGQKSWLAFTMAVAAASGKSVCGLTVKNAVPTWYINREGQERATSFRLAKIANTLDIGPRDLDRSLHWTHGGSFDLLNERHVARAVAFVKKAGFGLVVIDTLARSGEVDENAAKDMGRLIASSLAIKDAGCALVVVHHTNKATPKEVTSWPDAQGDVRGSSALVGAADVLVASRVYRVNGEWARYLILTGKEQEEQQLGYTFSDMALTGNKKAGEVPPGAWPTGDARFELSRVADDHFEPVSDDDAELL